MDEILPKDRVVASDSGHFCGWVPRYLRVPNPKASCLSHSFQSIGLGLASAIGLAIANPGKLAVLGAGDGGFMMSIADFETAIRLGLRMCILVYNDSSYAAEVHLFRRKRLFGGHRAVSGNRFRRDCARLWCPSGDGAQRCRSGAGTNLGQRGAPGVFLIDGKINPES